MLAAHIGDAEEKPDNTELLESKRAELDKLNRRMDKLLEMCTEDVITVQQYKEKTAKIAPDIERLKT